MSIKCPGCDRENSSFNINCPACGAQLPVSVIPETAQVNHARTEPIKHPAYLGTFEITGVLGEGGMSVVYRARDRELQRYVAVKRLHGAMGNERIRHLVLKEARLASALNHPNIVTIYQVHQEGDIPYIVMELVEGVTLEERLMSGALPIRQALRYAVQIADALTAAHDADVAHLDLKPGNIMITKADTIKIFDFGLARLARPEERAVPGERSGSVAGTVLYMSPEQTNGEVSGPASDIFSFGVVLYEMITGNRPFRAETISGVMDAIRHGSLEPIHNPHEATPSGLVRIIRKCMERKAHDRYSNMKSAATALREQLGRMSRRSEDRISLARAGLEPLKPKRRRLLIFLLPLLLIAISVPVVYYMSDRSAVEASPQSASLKTTRKLLITPFHMINQTPGDQALCDGLMEIISGKLVQASTSELWVIPTSEVRNLEQLSAGEARERFGADLVINGSVQRVGGLIRLTLNLVDTGDLRQIGSRTLEAVVGNMPWLQDEAVRAVAELLGIELENNDDLLRSNQTTSLDAYEFYLRGQGYLYRYDLEFALEEAIQAFGQALEQDSDYAAAHVGLAESWFLRWRRERLPEHLDQAAGSALRALELQKRLASAHHVMGRIQVARGQYESARDYFIEAAGLAPNNGETESELAKVLDRLGMPEQAEERHRKAVTLQPGNWIYRNRLGVFYNKRGRYTDAYRVFHQVYELTPDNVVCLNNLAATSHHLNKPEDALNWLQKALLIRPTAANYSNLGTTLFFLGRYGEAAEVFGEAVKLEDTHYVIRGNLADALRWSSEDKALINQTYARAIEMARAELQENTRNRNARISLALYLAKSGNALEGLEELKTLEPWTDSYVLYAAAVTHELAGKRKQAVALLNRAVAEGYARSEIDNDPELSGPRQDPDFKR